MSLTGHLYRTSPLRNWWERHSPGLGDACRDIARAAEQTTTQLSVAGMDHASLVGTIVSRMLEQDVEPAPPYAALMGGGRNADACLWPTHASLRGSRHEGDAIGWRPTPEGWQQLLTVGDAGGMVGDLHRAATLETTSTSPVADRAAAAGLIAIAETRYRTSGLRTPDLTAEAVTDAARVYLGMRQSPRTAAALSGGTLRGHAAPTMAAHWADADVLVGPGIDGGSTLLEVKTTSRSTTANPDRTVPWLWQLLSYGACDWDEDLWRIRRVGVWATRQDALITWSVDELLAAAGITTTGRDRLVHLILQAYQGDKDNSIRQ